MKPTNNSPAISFETEFTIGETIIVLHHSGNEVRHVIIRGISVIFYENGATMTISGVNHQYNDSTWHFFSCKDIDLAKQKMVEIQFANIKNKG